MKYSEHFQNLIWEYNVPLGVYVGPDLYLQPATTGLHSSRKSSEQNFQKVEQAKTRQI